jgi:hypothetical protein
MRLHLSAFASIGLLLSGCGSPGSITGAVRGQRFEVAEVLSVTDTDSVFGGDDTLALVLLSSRPGLCDAIAANAQLRDAQFLMIRTGTFETVHHQLHAPLFPGDFPVTALSDPSAPIPEGPLALVTYSATDGNCEVPPPVGIGTEGKITITSIGDDGSYAGSGNVVLDGESTLEVTFSGTPCKVLPSVTVGQYHPDTCQ